MQMRPIQVSLRATRTPGSQLAEDRFHHYFDQESHGRSFSLFASFYCDGPMQVPWPRPTCVGLKKEKLCNNRPCDWQVSTQCLRREMLPLRLPPTYILIIVVIEICKKHENQTKTRCVCKSQCPTGGPTVDSRGQVKPT